MSDEEAFFQAILETPSDDAPRLVFADWLEEHGQPERAEFIRLQCQLARLSNGSIRKALEVREQELVVRYVELWVGRIRDWVAAWCFRRGMLAITITAPALLGFTPEDDWFRRGMVQEMEIRHAVEVIDDLAQSPHLGRLHTLSLKGNGIGDVHVQALMESPHLTRLTKLGLSRNYHIGGGGVKALAESEGLPRLSVLDLSYNDIDDSDMLTIAASRNLGQLARLDLSNNPILSVEDAETLLSSPHLPRLAALYLGNTGIGVEGRKALLSRFGDRVHF